MDDLDNRILSALQSDFPLDPHPYHVLAQKLDTDPETILARVLALIDQGTIRRLGASLDSRKLGYSSTLAAVRVPENNVESAAEIINQYPEVTHNYLRENLFNIWFTLIAPSDHRIATILEEIRIRLALNPDDILNLPVRRLFKLDARFQPGG